MNTRLPGAVLAAVLTAQPAWAQPRQPGPHYPPALRGAWMAGDHPGCRAAEVPRNASDLRIGARHSQTLEARHTLVQLRRTAARRWQALERIEDGVRPASTQTVAMRLSDDGKNLTRTGSGETTQSTEHYTRCR